MHIVVITKKSTLKDQSFKPIFRWYIECIDLMTLLLYRDISENIIKNAQAGRLDQYTIIYILFTGLGQLLGIRFTAE